MKCPDCKKEMKEPRILDNGRNMYDCEDCKMSYILG